MYPLIGITGYRHMFASKLPGPALAGVAVSDDYAQGVEMAGGLPVLIPYCTELSTVRAFAEKLDGLVLSGGNDIDPMRFGEQPKIGLGEVAPERDSLELLLLAQMVSLGKPVLGICRGLQVINVAFGGTLYQDLPREWPGSIQHVQRARRSHMSHTVTLEPGSRLFDLLSERVQIQANSFHHQAIKDVGSELVAVAWDDEGLVEAIEHPDYPFLVAVQWHPENLWRDNPEFLGLFRGLVQACAAVPTYTEGLARAAAPGPKMRIEI